MVVKGIVGKMFFVIRGYLNVNVIEVFMVTEIVFVIYVSIYIICNKIESN